MANYDEAINIVFNNEGGFNSNLGDGEGMTYRGLTKKSDKDWSGWAYIDSYISKNGEPKEEYIFPELEQSVKDYYQKTYWQMAHGDELTNQDMANFLFSFFVNSGGAGKEINSAINKAMGSKVVAVTNKLSADSISTLNQNSEIIYPVLYQQRLDYLHSLDTWGKYGKSWERMMSMFPLTTNINRVLSSKTGMEGLAGIGFILVGVFGYLTYRKLRK